VWVRYASYGKIRIVQIDKVKFNDLTWKWRAPKFNIMAFEVIRSAAGLEERDDW